MYECVYITDDKIGNINPAKGLSIVLSEKMPLSTNNYIIEKDFLLRILPIWIFKVLPFFIPFFLRKHFKKEFLFKENFPHIIIGNGHNSVAICAMLRIYAKYKNFKSFFIQLQNPRISPRYFDIVIPPHHDLILGKNVISSIGSLNDICKEKVRDEDIPEEIKRLTKPIISVFVGGANKKYRFSIDDAKMFASELKMFQHKHDYSLCITSSRRTGKAQIEMMKSILGTQEVYFWDSSMKQKNPYLAMLKVSEYAIVTADSVNMVSEIASAGVMILLYKLKGDEGKFTYFYNALKKRRMIQDFSLTPKKIRTYPLAETRRIVKIILPKIQDCLK